MALTYGFYNSIEGDRVYDAIQFGRIFDGIIKDGVYATYEKGMMVIASSNPAEVIIQPGRAWFNHTWSYNDANVIFDAPAPEVLLERIDALVLEINTELSSRENSFKWVTGTPSSRPERPTLTNTSTIHQYPLCYVHRYPETTMIYTRDITNAIGTSECPFATGVLEGIDLDAWINQWDDEFHNWENTTRTGFETWMLNQEQVYTTWFNSMSSQMDTDLAAFEAWFQTIQGIIDEDAALHLQQEIDELRQEATSGSRIFVSTLNQSLYGRDVTITEAGGTVFTSRFDSNGVAEFKSIPYVGNLTISSTDGVQTATSVVNTPYYARYNFQIAFWAATVNIVGDPEMSGYTVTVRDSNEILVGTVVLDSEGAGIFTATAPDTYKFILTYGGETMEVTLSVTQETTYTVDLHAERFKWEDWVDTSKTLHSTDYESLEEVLSDEEAVRQLMLVHDCVDYMAGIEDEVEDVQTIIENDLCAKWINLSDYALDTLYANEIIAGYMDTADKYGYGELTITGVGIGAISNNSDLGTVTTDMAYSNTHGQWPTTMTGQENAYKVFDGTENANGFTEYADDNTPKYIQFTFAEPRQIYGAKVFFRTASVASNFTVSYQDSDNEWVSLGTLTDTASNGVLASKEFRVNNSIIAKAIKVTTKGGASNRRMVICEVEPLSYAPKGNVPIMTSATAPYGEVVNEYYSNPYLAFDGDDSTYTQVGSENTYASVGYKFTNPVCVKKIKANLGTYLVSNSFTIKYQASDDGTTWTDIGEPFVIEGNATGLFSSYEQEIDIDAYHLYYRLKLVTQKVSNTNVMVYTLQFYGRELKVSVPIMTANNAPYGEAFENPPRADVSQPAYKAFDGVDNYDSLACLNTVTGYIGYKFTNPVAIKAVAILGSLSTNYYNISPKTFKVQYSDDGTTWTDATNVLNYNYSSIDTVTTQHYVIDTASAHKYWSVYILTNGGSSLNKSGLTKIQFYGLDYSEKEFEEGTTKKWLYDHGVELVDFSFEGYSQVRNTFVTPIKYSDHIYSDIPGGSYVSNIAPDLAIDLTSFSLARCKAFPLKTPYNNSLSILGAKDNTNVTGAVSMVMGVREYALDISSIDQQAYPGIRLFGVYQSGSSYPSAAETTDLYELWLE